MMGPVLPAAWLLAFLGASDCDDAQPRLQAAAQAIESMDVHGAESILEPIESLSYRCPNVMIAIGRVAFAKGDYRRASTYSELAAVNAPENPEALLLRAEVLSAAGQSSSARDLLERAARIDPKNTAVHFHLGKVYDSAKLTARAISEFERAIELWPQDPQAYDYLALNLERMGEVARAEAAYVHGLDVNKGQRFDRLLDYNYGRLLLKLNRLDESKLHLDRAMELAPQMRAVHYDHAKLNLRLGKLENARLDAETALALPDPNGFILDLQLYNLLASICTRLGAAEAAQKYIDLARATPIPMRSRERD
jgi:tetratricopeptide (TPR) repeat protein